MIAKRVEQILRNAEVPESKVVIAAREIQKFYRDIPVPVVFYRSMYNISQKIFKIELDKALGAVGSPVGVSRSVDNGVSDSWMKDRENRKEKTHYDMKKETYREEDLTGATVVIERHGKLATRETIVEIPRASINSIGL